MGYLFRAIVVVKRFARRPANRIYKILLDLQVQNQLFVNLHTPHVQSEKEKLLQKSLHEAQPRRHFKDYYVISALICLIAGARYTKRIANLVRRVLCNFNQRRKKKLGRS